MIEWTGLDQMSECQKQKQAVLLLLRSLLQLSSACLTAWASSLCCSCSVNAGTFLVTSPACCGAWKRCGWILSSVRFLFVSVIVVSSDRFLQTPEGMALKHALVWMPSAFRHFSCWFGLRCTRNCRFPLVAQTSSVSRHGKKFPVSTDILGQFCSVGVSLLDLFSHMLQVNCRQLPPAGLFAEIGNLVLHLSMSLWKSLLLNNDIPSSLHSPWHLVFLKCDLVLSGMQAPAGAASHVDSHPPMVSPFSSGSLSPLHSHHLSTKASSVDCIPNLIGSKQCLMVI